MDDVSRALADDLEGSFERLVLTYQDRLFAFALRLTGNPSDAEEVAQDAFVRAYRALARYPSERVATLALRPWLYQITLNVVRNRVRGRRLTTVSLGESPNGTVLEPVDEHAEDPPARAERVEQADELGTLVAALPERYRVAVVLRHVEDFRYAEIAELLGQPVGTVKANVHRGVRLLRAAIEGHEPSLTAAQGVR